MNDNLERLILYLENELPQDERKQLEADLEQDDSLRQELAELEAAVSIVVEHQPEAPGDEYFRHFYNRLQPKLQQDRTFLQELLKPFAGINRLGLAGGLATIAVAFLLVAVGINTFLIRPNELPSARNEKVSIKRSERFFDYIAEEHLQKSQLLLREVYNISQDETLDIEALGKAQARGSMLLSENRSYREAAIARGADELVDLLNELELILVEISNMDQDSAEYALPSLRRAIRKKNLLIKIEIINLNDLGEKPAREITEVV